MAIRDRITVKTKDGMTTVIQATKAGGRVESETKTREGTLIVEEFGQAKDPIQVLTVQLSELVWMRKETDVPASEDRPKRTKRPRKVE